MARAALSGLPDTLNMEVAVPNLEQLTEVWDTIYIHLVNIITQVKCTTESNAFQTHRMILSELTDILPVTFKDRITSHNIIPSGPARDNCYPPSHATFVLERVYKNASRQASGKLPGLVKSLYTKCHSEYKTLVTTMGATPMFREEVESQFNKLGKNFVSDMIRMISYECGFAEMALQAGFLELIHELNSQYCIPHTTMTLMKMFGTDFTEDAAKQLVSKRESLQLKVDDNMRYIELLEQYVEMDRHDAFIMSRDPYLCVRKLINLYKDLGQAEEFNLNEENNDPRYTAKLTDSAGVVHRVMGHMFMSEHCMNSFDKEIGVEKGRLTDQRPAYLLPTKSLLEVPDKSIYKTMVLGPQTGPAPEKLHTIEDDTGLMIEDNENPEMITTTKLEIANTILSLTKHGRNLFQEHTDGENAAAASGSLSNGVEVPIGKWAIDRDTKFIRGTEGDIYTVESIKMHEGKPNALTQRRNVVTVVTMGTFNRDFCHDSWANEQLAKKFTKFIPAEKFQCPDVEIYTPSIKTKITKFTMRDMMPVCMDRDIHVVADQLRAMNEELHTARTLTDDSESQELNDQIFSKLEIAGDNKIYDTYWENRGGELECNGDQIRGDSTFENSRMQLRSNEVGPLFELVSTEETMRLTGKVLKVFGMRRRKIVHEIPPYVLDMRQRKARGGLMLAHLASNIEQLIDTNNSFTKARCYLRNIPSDGASFGDPNIVCYFDGNATTGSPYLPRKADGTAIAATCSVTEDDYVEAVKTTIQQIIASVKNTYKTAHGSEDRSGLRAVNYLFDAPTEQMIEFKIFEKALGPVLTEGKWRSVFHRNAGATVVDANGPTAAVMTIAPEKAMTAFQTYDGGVGDDTIGKMTNFNVGDKLPRDNYPITKVTSGNVMDLCTSATNVILRLYTTVAGYDYTSPAALHKQVQNKQFPPFFVHFFCKYSIASDNIMLVQPEGITNIQNGTKITSNSKNVNGDTNFHLTVGVKTASNHRVAPGVIMRTVHQNPMLTNNSVTSQNTPIINMDHYNKSAHGNYVNMLNSDRINNYITDTDYDVMMREYNKITDSQHSPIPSEVTVDVNGCNVDGSSVHKYFNDYVYTISPANRDPVNAKPVPMLGFPLYMAKNLASGSQNAYVQFYTSTDPSASQNVWASNFLSTFQLRFTPNGTKYTARFPAHTTCFDHNKTTVSNTRAMFEQMYKIDVSSRAADLTEDEKTLTCNFTLEKHRTTPDLTVSGVSFLNPIVDPQLGDSDGTTKMGLATPDSQYTNRDFYTDCERSLNRYKLGHESKVLVDPMSQPLYEGGGGKVTPCPSAELGPNVYYIRGQWSSNRLLTSPTL